MSRETLEMLAAIPDISNLKDMIKQDPQIPFVEQQNLEILNQISTFHSLQTPVLDLNTTSISEANKFLATLQSIRNNLTFFSFRLEEYESTINRYWSLAYNLCMIQNSIESLRSNDQRMAYIEQLFPELIDLKRKISVTKRKLTYLSDNVTNSFFTLQQQQKNLQLVQNQFRG